MSTSQKDTEPLLWFAARTRHGQELSVRDKLCNIGIECFIPTRIGFNERRGRRRKVEKPLISNLVFLRAEKERACAAANSLVPIFFIIDNITHSMLVVPDKQMDDFRRILDLNPEAIQEEQLDIRPGHRVRVVKGPLVGIEGDVVEYAGKTNIVLTLSGGLMQAKAEIPIAYLEKI